MTRSRAVDRPSLLKAEGPERLVHRARRGADLKHRARDALGLADLRLFGLQHASMLRGVGVRGSFGAQERPARPRHFEARRKREGGLRRTRRRSKNTGDDARLAHPVPAAGTG